FVAAAAVVVAVAAIVLGNVHTGKPQPTAATAEHSSTTTASGTKTSTPAKPTTTTAAAPPAATPTNFAPQSFTAIGELTWWLLGPGPCPSGEQTPCGSILQTTDGGRHFTAIHAPAAPLVTSEGGTSGYSQIRFADAHNGFAYGPGLYATHDGGATWHPVDVGGTVTDLAISAGQAFATVEPSSGSGKLMHAAVSGDAWSAVSAAGDVSGGLWVQGSTIIVQSGQGTGIGGNVLVSSDGGQSFTAHPAPSPGLPCLFAAPTPPVVWARCATGMNSGVWRSSDGGATLTAVVSTGLSLPNSAPFAAASSSTAVVGAEQLYRTTNDGSTWSQTGPTGIRWTYLGFTDPTHGVALGFAGQNASDERLYYTTDAGQSYHRVSLP
ncbi:MAG TPA: hypothetical protein VJ741_01830, partial [Solirubrobacteraceae bacterium]|nr:hypothetical protein [Solirubrobacteraceae bacterium]